MSDTSHARGRQAESLAADHLQSNGLRLLQRNYRCRHGEIDLVMQDDSADCLVFVEVRFRRRSRYGGAAASVTAGKRQRLAKTVLHYLQHCGHDARQRVRVDVIAIRANRIPHPHPMEHTLAMADGRQWSLQWLQNIDLPMFG